MFGPHLWDPKLPNMSQDGIKTWSKRAKIMETGDFENTHVDLSFMKCGTPGLPREPRDGQEDSQDTSREFPRAFGQLFDLIFYPKRPEMAPKVKRITPFCAPKPAMEWTTRARLVNCFFGRGYSKSSRTEDGPKMAPKMAHLGPKGSHLQSSSLLFVLLLLLHLILLLLLLLLCSCDRMGDSHCYTLVQMNTLIP